jgi:hypothetical protein
VSEAVAEWETAGEILSVAKDPYGTMGEGDSNPQFYPARESVDPLCGRERGG